MAIETVGGWGGYRNPFDRSREVRELIETSIGCGVSPDPDLYWKIVGIVYDCSAENEPNMLVDIIKAVKEDNK